MSTKEKFCVALGVALLLAMACLLAPSMSPFFLFITGFTSVMLWVLGVTRTPQFVVRRRKEIAKELRQLPEPHIAVSEQTFVNKPTPWIRFFLFVMGGIPLALGVVLLATAFVAPKSAGVLVALSVMALLYGAFMTRLAWQLPKMVVRVDAQGIESTGILFVRRLAWDDIVAFTKKQYRMQGADFQTNYVAYGRDSSVEISGKLLEIDRLISIIEANLPPSALLP